MKLFDNIYKIFNSACHCFTCLWPSSYHVSLSNYSQRFNLFLNPTSTDDHAFQSIEKTADIAMPSIKSMLITHPNFPIAFLISRIIEWFKESFIEWVIFLSMLRQSFYTPALFIPFSLTFSRLFLALLSLASLLASISPYLLFSCF